MDKKRISQILDKATKAKKNKFLKQFLRATHKSEVWYSKLSSFKYIKLDRTEFKTYY